MRNERSAFFGDRLQSLARDGASKHLGSPLRRIAVAHNVGVNHLSNSAEVVEVLREVVARFMFHGLANRNYANVFTTLVCGTDIDLAPASRPKVRNRRSL